MRHHVESALRARLAEVERDLPYQLGALQQRLIDDLADRGRGGR